jgi:hypothetical protein
MRQDVINTLEVFRYACIHPSQNVNWDREAVKRIEETLLSHPKLERLHALIYQNAIARKQLDWFDGCTQTNLKKITYAIVADITAKRAFIHKLITVLARNDISVIVLKGMAFNGDIYSLSCPRGVSDIDILIQPQDKENFERHFAEFAAKVVVEKKYAFDDLYEEAWRSNDAKHLIDVHTHLTNPKLFNIEQNDLWQMSKPHPYYDSPQIRVLSTEHTLLHIVTHVINDTNFYHYNLVDVIFLLLKYQFDSAILERTAKNWGVWNATRYLFSCVNRCAISQQLPDYPSTGWAKIRAYFAWMLIDHVFILKSREKSLLHRFKQVACYLVITDRFTPAISLITSYFGRQR